MKFTRSSRSPHYGNQIWVKHYRNISETKTICNVEGVNVLPFARCISTEARQPSVTEVVAAPCIADPAWKGQLALDDSRISLNVIFLGTIYAVNCACSPTMPTLRDFVLSGCTASKHCCEISIYLFVLQPFKAVPLYPDSGWQTRK